LSSKRRRPRAGIWGQKFNPWRCETQATFDGAFAAAKQQHPAALITVEDPLTITYRKRIADFAVAEQLPSLYGLRDYVEVGGLISYGANLTDLHRRAAGYVDKILKGAMPANLPVQQPTQFNFNYQPQDRQGTQLGRAVVPARARGRGHRIVTVLLRLLTAAFGTNAT
jgi:ABC-type uncharacterized transport system substrate-binding protein